jgi:hypothetical protein
MSNTNGEANMSKVEGIRDGDDRYRVVRNGSTIGFITKWYERDSLRSTGIKRFHAKPIGCSIARPNCETYSSAVAYIIAYIDG